MKLQKFFGALYIVGGLILISLGLTNPSIVTTVVDAICGAGMIVTGVFILTRTENIML